MSDDGALLKLYNEKTEGISNKGYIANTFDFKAFEEYISEHYPSDK